MRKRHDAQRCKAAERQPKAAAVLPTVDTNTRRLGIGGGGDGEEAAVGASCPKRLKYGSSDHISDLHSFLWPYVASVRPPGLLRLVVFFPECPLCK